MLSAHCPTWTFPDSITNYVVQVFSATGLLLVSESATRTPGSGPATFTFYGLPEGSVVVRVVAGDVLGFQVGAALNGQSGAAEVTLTFEPREP